MTKLIVWGIFLAHLNAYRDYYANIGITFAITYVMKRLVRSMGENDQADLVGLGGYSLTIGEFTKLIGAMKKNGIQGSNAEEAHQIVGGMLGKGIDMLKDIIIHE